jgi:hypothetical protein
MAESNNMCTVPLQQSSSTYSCSYLLRCRCTLSGGALRNYVLRSQKKKGPVFEAPLAEILFLGVAPREYISGEPLAFYADLVESKKYHVPVHY